MTITIEELIQLKDHYENKNLSMAQRLESNMILCDRLREENQKLRVQFNEIVSAMGHRTWKRVRAKLTNQ